MALWLFFELIGLNIGSVTPPTGVAWSAWMYEEAIVRPLTPGGCRLSGMSMGNSYYFGTGPTTADLSVASTKGGMSSQLN